MPCRRPAPPISARTRSDLLQSSPLTAGWHAYGMEWKEHIAWFTPIAMTMVAYVFIKYGPRLVRFRHTAERGAGLHRGCLLRHRRGGLFGAFLNKYAPVRGGPEIVLLQEK